MVKQGNTIQKLKTFLLHCLCPTRCACCSEVIYQGQELCPSCKEKVKELQEMRCRKCNAPLHLCNCSHGKVTTVDTLSAFPYTSVVQEGILTMKKGTTHGIAYFAKALAKVIENHCPNTFQGIVFVPVTKAKKQKRGYNQCELLAKALGKELKLPVFHNALVRLYDTVDLHKSENINRKGCVFGVFDAKQELVENKTLLLIDDVVTTGATLNECAKMLYLANANEVFAATIATRHLQLVKENKE